MQLAVCAPKNRAGGLSAKGGLGCRAGAAAKTCIQVHIFFNCRYLGTSHCEVPTEKSSTGRMLRYVIVIFL